MHPFSRAWRQRKAERPGNPTRLAVELLEDRTVPSLVAAYPFNEVSGATVRDGTWHEGGGNPGTISGATRTTEGRYGAALSFDGIDDWVTVPDALPFDFTTGMTLEAWVRPTADASDWTTALLKERSGGLAYALYAADGAGSPPAGYMNRNGTDVQAAGDSVLPSNAWSHLAVTYDGAALRLYVNGTQVSSTPETGNITTSTGPLRIGGNAVWGEFFTGLIDEIRLYNNALTASQIQTDMATPINKPPGASALASPTSGPPGMTVNFDGRNSGDEDGHPVTYEWDLDADGQFDDSTSPTPSYTYPNAGRYPVKLRVTDPLGATGIATVFINVGNQPPDAVAKANSTSGPPGMTVNFDGRNSRDPEGDPLTYEWDLDADGEYDDSTSATPSFTYATAGRYTVGLRVTDTLGVSDTDTVEIKVSQAPAAVIDTPSPGPTWTVGETITFSGHADDAEDGSLPAAALTWKIDLHTGLTRRTVYSFSGVSGGSFSTPDAKYPAQLELILVATDSYGMTNRKSIFLYPQTVSLRIESSPSGLRVAFNDMVNVNGTSPHTPYTATAIVGSTNTITALSPQFLGGTKYDFASWSDNGAKTHNITAPAGPATYTATYTVGATDLVGAWGFNETSGSLAYDNSGNGLNGTLAGSGGYFTSSGGKYGGAVYFDGASSWITVSDRDVLDLTTGMTLEAWVRPTSLLGGWKTAIMKERPDGLAYALYATDGANQPPAGYIHSGVDRGVVGSSTLSLNTWTHLATTYDGAALRLYVNGTLVASQDQTGDITTSGGALRFGGNSSWGEYYQGYLDEVRIYNRALSATEIQADMNTPVGSPERLLGEEVPVRDAPSLSQEEFLPLFNEALMRWSVELDDAEAVQTLRAVRVEVLDLPGTTLGLASGAVIYLDANGAGHGWFLDPTPWDDSEFAPGLVDSPAVGRVDLLTVITHEMGHILGLDDDSETDPFTGTAMADALPLGVRRIHLDGLLPDVLLSSTIPPISGAAVVARRQDSEVRGAGGTSPASAAGRTADVPDTPFDLAADNTIWLDAEVWDWFLAPTDGEFFTHVNRNEKYRLHLLTVVSASASTARIE